jgi:hypothetical protein
MMTRMSKVYMTYAALRYGAHGLASNAIQTFLF